ncbi:hypothetical protein H0H81_003841 [Sphagnurus paluster]|uniref:HTH APSES-type domain-containing protein n=1 Tax=Sphagnurus paluster TaxID=117069 RepID=A0A9P7KK52_9AGAR|nr:hypothetical protein H0H81_003841 [Sphagnurus paluster]
MIDSQPDLAPVIRRVRGGYLKIQGTWMPYEVALRLSRRVAWTIRDDLIPLFGPTFPSTCLSPDQPGYGQVVASGPNRRRTRRNAAAIANANAPREAQASWTVVTPSDPGHSRQPSSSQYLHTAFYPPNRDVVHYQQQNYQPQAPASYSPRSPDSPASPISTSRSSVRYSPYSTHAPHPARRLPSEARSNLSLDIPSLSLRDSNQPSSASVQGLEHINLPPIQAPPDGGHSRSPYALPPISAMEDLRGLDANDSAAVLRRLRSDEPPPPEPTHHAEVWRRRSFSSRPHRLPEDMASPHSHPALVRTSRSYPDHLRRSRTPSEGDGDYHRRRVDGLSLSAPSEASYDGASTCDPSPISPATPSSSRDHHGPAPVPPGKDYTRAHAHGLAVPVLDAWTRTPPQHLHHRHEEIRDNPARRRLSDADGETHPHRPW